jgi:hypothetical protein
VCAGGGFGWLDADLVAQALELLDEPADVGLVGLALQEVLAAEVGVRLAPVQHVVGADQDGMPDRDRGPSSLRRPPRRQYWAAGSVPLVRAAAWAASTRMPRSHLEHHGEPGFWTSEGGCSAGADS